MRNPRSIVGVAAKEVRLTITFIQMQYDLLDMHVMLTHSKFQKRQPKNPMCIVKLGLASSVP